MQFVQVQPNTEFIALPFASDFFSHYRIRQVFWYDIYIYRTATGKLIRNSTNIPLLFLRLNLSVDNVRGGWK